jgi:site-specific DNA recombinase
MERQTLDAYLRVSRVGGRNGDSFISPVEQETAIDRRIAELGAVRGMTVTETDVSGAKPVASRELEKLVRRVERGESQGIAIFSVDRWSREAADALQAAKRIHDAGARLVDTKGVDSSTEAGNLMLGMMSVIAQQQRTRLKSGFQAASRNAVERGLHVGAFAPAGYDRTDGPLTPNADAEAIREAFARRARGESFQSIADFLTEAGVKPGGSNNERWSRSGAQTLVSNRVYLGEVRGQRNDSGTQVVNRKAHEPIVSPELFAAANREGQRALRNGKLQNAGLLAGLITCAGCGHKLRRKASGETLLYACAKHYAGGDCPAPAAATIRLVDDFVVTRSNRRKRNWRASRSQESRSTRRSSSADTRRESRRWRTRSARSMTTPTQESILMRSSSRETASLRAPTGRWATTSTTIAPGFVAMRRA